MKRSLLLGLLLAVGCIDFDDLASRALGAADGGTSGGSTSGGSGGGSTSGGSGGGSTSGGSSGGSTSGGGSGGSTSGGSSGGSTSGGSSGGSTSGGSSGGSTSGGSSGGSTSGGSSGGSTSGGSSGGSTSGGSSGGTSGGAALLPDGGPFRLCDCVGSCPSRCQVVDLTSGVATPRSGRMQAIVESNALLFAAVVTSDGGEFVTFTVAKDAGTSVLSSVAFTGDWRDLDARFGTALGLSSGSVAFSLDGGWLATVAPTAPPLTGGVYQSTANPGRTEAATYLDERPTGVEGYAVDFENQSLARLSLTFSAIASRARIRPTPAGTGYFLTQYLPTDGGANGPWFLYDVGQANNGGSTGQYFKQVEMSSSASQRTFVAVNTDAELRTWHVTGSAQNPTLPTVFDHRITNPLNLNLRGASTFDAADGGSVDLIVVEQSGANPGFWIDGAFVPAFNEWFVIVFGGTELFLFRIGPALHVTATLTSPSSFVAGIECGNSPTGTRTCISRPIASQLHQVTF